MQTVKLIGYVPETVHEKAVFHHYRNFFLPTAEPTLMYIIRADSISYHAAFGSELWQAISDPTQCAPRISGKPVPESEVDLAWERTAPSHIPHYRELFIHTTSDLDDAEVQLLNQEIARQEAHYPVGDNWIASHFVSEHGKHCYNINPKRRYVWNRLWGVMKTKLYMARCERRALSLRERADGLRFLSEFSNGEGSQ